MGVAQEAIGSMRRIFEDLPQGSYRFVYDRTEDDIDEYFRYEYGGPVVWEVLVEPARKAACPIGLLLVIGEPDDACDTAWGFLFDRRKTIAQRLGLKIGWWNGDSESCGFGTEPVHMSTEHAKAIVSAGVRGSLVLEYRSVLGYLQSTRGYVGLESGAERFWHGPLRGPFVHTFQYDSWI